MAGWGLWNNDIEFISSQHAPAVSYIHQPGCTAGLRAERKKKTSGETWWKTTSCYQAPALYIYQPLFFLHPFSSAQTIILSPHILFAFFCRGVLQHIHPPFLHLPNSPSLSPTQTLPPCLSFSREVSTISLATAGWGVLSSQVQGDGRLGRLASTHSVFTLRYLLPMNTKLHWTWGV